jgi:hypothetical protein
MDAHENELSGLRSDLVEYMIISMPDLSSLAGMAAPLAEMVDAGLLRILDLVVLSRDKQGAIEVLELDAVSDLPALRNVDGGTYDLLSDHDLELASLGIRAVGIVLVTEGRWARPLAEAAARAGGRIVAGERIPPARVDAAIANIRARQPEGE